MYRWLLLVALIGLTLVNAAAPAAEEISDEHRAKITAALPAKARATPVKPRKLLIFDRNVGYGGHGSIPHANMALTLMGETTGTFTAEVSSDPVAFRPDALRTFDAVFFNNTVGNLFEDKDLRRSLVEFVYRGGGLMGVHGATTAFTIWPGARETWPEFGVMLGARGASHRDNTEHVFVRLDDPGHPLNRAFNGKGFEYRDEFFRVHEPYSRNRVRVLLSIDTERTDMNQGLARGKCVRDDGDYALAWVRSYGRGRVFYCTIAHNPYVFWDKTMLAFYLDAAQFVLGDLPAPTTPSARRTPATDAAERLGWRHGVAAAASGETLFESAERASRLGAIYLSAIIGQPVSASIARPFDAELSAEQLEQIRLRLDELGVRLLTCRLEGRFDAMRRDEAHWRRTFAFARTMGLEALIGEANPEAFALLSQLCDEYDLKFALSGGDSPPGTDKTGPQAAAKAFAPFSRRLGLHVDLAAWQREGVDPGEAVQAIGERLLSVEVPVMSGREGSQAYQAYQKRFLAEIAGRRVRPVMFAVARGHTNEATAAEAEALQRLNTLFVEIDASEREGRKP